MWTKLDIPSFLIIFWVNFEKISSYSLNYCFIWVFIHPSCLILREIAVGNLLIILRVVFKHFLNTSILSNAFEAFIYRFLTKTFYGFSFNPIICGNFFIFCQIVYAGYNISFCRFKIKVTSILFISRFSL